MNALGTIALGLLVLSLAAAAHAQPAGFNYDEDQVPDYTLPDPLVFEDGEPVADADAWRDRRRAEVLRLFEEHVYGRTPERWPEVRFEVHSVDEDALDGKATRQQVSAYFDAERDQPRMDLLIYLPNDAEGPAPTFLGLNFSGNHTVEEDPAIRLPESWVRNSGASGVTDNTASDEGRGSSAGRWPVGDIIERGYGVVTIYYGDISPDDGGRFREGIHAVLDPEAEGPPGAEEWGAIGAWAWGLSRAMDYLETEDRVDAERVVVLGHSRLGKTSLWAGAQDERFALVISNQSGCGGAALSRRRFGETVERINDVFPHWFCGNFKRYNENEGALPVDQHMLVALAAPRPVLVCSAEEDRWADPRGEFLAAQHASPVYRLLGAEGLAADQMPGNNELIESTVGYHIRPGQHGVTPDDWSMYMDFADAHLGR